MIKTIKIGSCSYIDAINKFQRENLKLFLLNQYVYEYYLVNVLYRTKK